jgi:transcriptional regulator with XRE-family HTH domain
MGKRWWSGAKLAAETGLSQNYLAKRLRDERPFTLNDIDRIGKALEIDPSILALAPLVAGVSSSSKQPTNS